MLSKEYLTQQSNITKKYRIFSNKLPFHN